MNEPRIQETKTQMARDDLSLYVCVWNGRRDSVGGNTLSRR